MIFEPQRHKDTKVDLAIAKSFLKIFPFVKTKKFLSESGNKDVVGWWLVVSS
jgi:hypothetical protein